MKDVCSETHNNTAVQNKCLIGNQNWKTNEMVGLNQTYMSPKREDLRVNTAGEITIDTILPYVNYASDQKRSPLN